MITWSKQFVFEVVKDDGMTEKMGKLPEIEERDSLMFYFVEKN